MAPAIINAIIKSTLGARQAPPSDLASLGPLTVRAVLTARDNAKPQVEPGAGMINPHDINNNAVFAIFGILGAGFVVLGIWFFFWAKNGGFYFKENDWDEYKSTVLRRKGPNGTTLSGATESTVLGGGSVYKDVDDMTNGREDATTVISATTGITGITGGVSDFSGREKRRKKREQKEREKERRREEKSREKEERKSRRRVGADGVLVDEEAEYDAKEHLRSYRHEKAARVGGINKESEASEWDGSTNPTHSTASGSGVGYSTESGSTVTSELIQNREKTPTSTPTKLRKGGEDRPAERSGGIRKVYSMADKTARREDERLRAEARRLAEKGRAHRREPSWHRSDDLALRRIDEQSESLVSHSVVSESVVSESRAPESRIPGSWAESDIGTSSEVSGTKVYKHPVHIPVSNGGSSAPSDLSYTEEKRRRRRA
ncbi:hypothetical protein B0T16DRAFT_454164 [Cercophora newfieldiana]|uniref:Endosomal spry domain-containing protein n=1 Tax=Cercophora newfieldiana TaxID=92897 RepID=A0AA39YFK4_9PEZI|nr:hypothetical protein B0T16DRAFT_454164 [Cercophora newfieldiana]